jgi:hypothetical protein
MIKTESVYKKFDRFEPINESVSPISFQLTLTPSRNAVYPPFLEGKQVNLIYKDECLYQQNSAGGRNQHKITR